MSQVARSASVARRSTVESHPHAVDRAGGLLWRFAVGVWQLLLKC